MDYDPQIAAMGIKGCPSITVYGFIRITEAGDLFVHWSPDGTGQKLVLHVKVTNSGYTAA